jgi:membrane protein implicated in regulation of membrane protease activity
MSGWIWWVLVLILIGVEMVTGTFYLLALAIAFAGGGLVDYFGGGLVAQLSVAGVVGTAGCIAAYYYQQKRRREVKEEPSTLDIGGRVQVLHWNDDGTARVFYRGAQWDAVLANEDAERKKEMKIVEQRGNTLVLG